MEVIGGETKRCSKCGEVKELGEFGKRNRGTAYRAECKDCCAIRHREWREKNKNHHNEYQKRYYNENKGRILEKGRAWRKANRSREQRHKKEYYNENKEQLLKKSRANKLRSLYGITEQDYDTRLNEQNGGCYLCGKTPKENGKQLAVDHDRSCCPGRKTCGGCVRKLLCDECNKRLGHYETNRPRHAEFEAYIQEHQSKNDNDISRT